MVLFFKGVPQLGKKLSCVPSGALVMGALGGIGGEGGVWTFVAPGVSAQGLVATSA